MKILFIKKSKARSLLLIFIIFLVPYTITLLWLAYKINVSEDETYTLNTTSYHLFKVIYQSYHFEGQLPAYFILLNIWRQLNNGIFFTRIFSVLLILFSAFYFNKIIKLISNKENSLWITTLYLINPFIIWSALEIRPYALVVLLSVISLFYFFKYYLTNLNRYLIILVAVSLIGLFTQYFYTFLISSYAFLILFFKGIRPFIKYCLFLLPAVLLFLPNLYFIAEQYNLHTSPFSSESSIIKTSVIFYTIKDFLFADNHAMINIWLSRGFKLIFCILIIYVYSLVLRKKIVNNKSQEIINLILLLNLLLIIHFFVFVLTSSIGFANRYLAIIFPVLMMIFFLFEFLPNILNKILYISFFLYYMSQSIIFYTHPVKSYDYISMAAYIKNTEFVNEPIIFYRPGLSLPFKYYYMGNNPIFPLPHEVRFDTNYIINIKDSSALGRSLDRINEDFKSMLFISDLSQYEYNVNMNRGMIDKYLKSHYKISLDTLYQGWSKEGSLRIRRLERIH